MTNRRDTYITGLKNAHALENQALELIKRQLDRVESYPDVRIALSKHLEETQRQKDILQRILDRHGEQPSTLKDMATALTGNMAAIAHSVMSDEILRNMFANVAFEHFEIASYRSLIAMARLCGDEESVPHLQGILREEEAAASTFAALIEPVTEAYILRLEEGRQAAV